MKVVDVTEFYSERGGGVRSYLESKQHILSQLGHVSVVLVPGERSRSTPGVKRLGGPPMPYDPTYHLLWRPDKIRAAVGEARPDVLEIHSPYVAALGGLASSRSAFRIRTFMWHSDFIDTYERVFLTWSGASRRWGAMQPATRPLLSVAGVGLWAWVRRIARGCDAVFCASAWQARKLASHGVRATRVRFGVDKAFFHPREKVLPHLGAKGVRLVAAGRLAVEKQWDVVLSAFRRTLAQHPGATLTVFGDGPERARLEALAGGGVTFAGFVRDRATLAEALASADALVHGCPHETFGIAVAEAIACGAPIVVPDEGGAAELAPPECSETYRAGDVEGCAAAIERLLLRRGPRLREAALEASRGVASVEDHFAELLGHYRALLGRGA